MILNVSQIRASLFPYHHYKFLKVDITISIYVHFSHHVIDLLFISLYPQYCSYVFQLFCIWEVGGLEYGTGVIRRDGKVKLIWTILRSTLLANLTFLRVFIQYFDKGVLKIHSMFNETIAVYASKVISYGIKNTNYNTSSMKYTKQQPM